MRSRLLEVKMPWKGMRMHEDFWAGKRVFVTGHTGFKGSWLALWLSSIRDEVTGLSLSPETAPNHYTFARMEHGIASILGDICVPVLVRHAMAEACLEIVIHMAAQPLVRHSYANPLATYATNVMGTVHVLKAKAKMLKLDCFKGRSRLGGSLGGCRARASKKSVDCHRAVQLSKDMREFTPGKSKHINVTPPPAHDR